MAIRGKPTVTLTNQTTALLAPMREHSRKPDEFYALVESLCPGNKLELFSRQKRAGWQCEGAEVEAFVAVSGREYLDQIEAYKSFGAGDKPDAGREPA